jgi:cytochrome b subunit of formate dehydrogenase
MINIFTNGFGLVFLMYLLAFIFGFIYRAILKKLSEKKLLSVEGRGSKNIGKSDRMLRFVIGIGLLAWAIMTSLSPILLFFSGFCIFESIFSWCGFYAAIGKTTCPVE